MNLSTEHNSEINKQLEELFEAKEAVFQENLYKSWAMAERDSTYEAVKEIAIALIKHGTTIAVISSLDKGTFAQAVVKQAIKIHEEIKSYSDNTKGKNNETQLHQQND